MITPTIAIGNFTSSYYPFDVIVNLNFPYNNAEHKSALIDHTKEGKTIFRIGMNDAPDEDMYGLLRFLIPKLVAIYQSHPTYKFLFHCYAGISRSSTVAIAFLAVTHRLSYSHAYEIVAAKRPIIKPNVGFLNALHEYLKNENKNDF
jgi:protein-tyrosine phosphatase